MRPRDESGASAVEYGLLVGGIAALVVSVVFLLGGTVRDTLFDPGCDELAGHIATANGTENDCN